MWKIAIFAVSVLFASCLSTGQVQAPKRTVDAAPSVTNEPSQTDNRTGEILTLHSHARQVLVTASVWKHAPKSAAWVPKEVLKRDPSAADTFAMPPVATGLSANDFRVFDNGAEQRINYLEESSFSWRDINQQWSFFPHIGGTWGVYTSSDVALAPPTATYIIGYIPPPLPLAGCHTIRLVSGDNEVMLNRTQY